MKKSKKYIDASKLYDKTAVYEFEEAVALVKKMATAKFDETIEAHLRLGVDGRHADQQVRGAVVLPHGTGKTVKVLVFAKGDKVDEALAAGADCALFASEGAVLRRHVLRNAALPIITSSVAVIPMLFMGSLIMESFFGIPGLGSYTIDALGAQDFSVVRTMVFLGTFAYIIGLIATDIVYAWVDPRIRLA